VKSDGNNSKKKNWNMMERILEGRVKCEARYLKDNWDTMQESEGKWLE
jgi:hypothetical protein